MRLSSWRRFYLPRYIAVVQLLLLLPHFSAVNGMSDVYHAVFVALYQKLSWRCWPEGIVSCRHKAHHTQLEVYPQTALHTGRMGCPVMCSAVSALVGAARCS